MNMSLFRILKRFLRRGTDEADNDSIPVAPRDVSFAMISSNGTELFDQQAYLEINEARMTHLDSLKLTLEAKTVLDAGCGVGNLAQYFVRKGCKVVCVDARQENIDELRLRYPDLCAYTADLEKQSLGQFGEFEVVFCYGLLYHLENPLAALRNMAAVCKELLVIETMICDHALAVLRIVDEHLAFTQSLRGVGCRPSPSYVATALNRIGFPFVYTPKVPPEHPDFTFEWKSNLDWHRDGRPLRCVFVASRAELQNPRLTSLLKESGTTLLPHDCNVIGRRGA